MSRRCKMANRKDSHDHKVEAICINSAKLYQQGTSKHSYTAKQALPMGASQRRHLCGTPTLHKHPTAARHEQAITLSQRGKGALCPFSLVVDGNTLSRVARLAFHEIFGFLASWSRGAIVYPASKSHVGRKLSCCGHVRAKAKLPVVGQ
jgi:hypothetical protein